MNPEVFVTDARAAELKQVLLAAVDERNQVRGRMARAELAVQVADRALTDYLTALEGGAA